MIIGNIFHLDKIKENLTDDILYSIDYAKNHDLINYTSGWYDTEKKHIRFRIDEYSTQIPRDRFWESHKYHLDMYIMLRGKEEFHISPVQDMNPYHYIMATDLVMYEDTYPKTIHRLTRPGDFIICTQEEAHKTGVNVDLRNVFKKVLFKINCQNK